MREADFPPTPGSLVSSLMRFARGGAVICGLLSCWVGGFLGCRYLATCNRATLQPSKQSRNLHPAGHCADGACHLLIDLARRFVHGGNDQILQHLDVIGVDGFLVDGDGQQLLGAVHRRLDHPASGASLDAQRRHALLHLLLHLLHLLHQLLRIHEISPYRFRDSTRSAPRCFWKAWTTGSSRRGDDAFAAWAAAEGESSWTSIDIASPKTSAASCSRVP